MAKKGFSPIERAVLNKMDLMCRMLMLSPERFMQFETQRLKRSLRSKISRSYGYRALMTQGIAQQANAKIQQAEGRMQEILQATGQASVEGALNWIAEHQGQA